MVRRLLKLSVFCLLLCLTDMAKADSFFVSEVPVEQQNIQDDHIIPLVYIKHMEYYNHTHTAAYTGKIAEMMSLEPKIIVTDNESMADYYLLPRLERSRIERINPESSRYSMSLSLELWSKGGILFDREEQNRYIIIENNADPQEIAQKLLIKLLQENIRNLSQKIKNNELPVS